MGKLSMEQLRPTISNTESFFPKSDVRQNYKVHLKGWAALSPGRPWCWRSAKAYLLVPAGSEP